MTQRSLVLIVLCTLLVLLAPQPDAGALGDGDAGDAELVQLSTWRMALQQPHAPGEIMVRFRSNAASTLAQHPNAPTALAAAEHLEQMPALGLHRYRVAGDLELALARLNADPAVEFAEPNYRIYPAFEPNDPLYLSYAANDGVASGGYLNRLNMAAAWDLARGSPSIIVAVIDSGIDLDHEDLAGALWQNPGEIPGNGLDDDGNGLVDDVFGWNFAADSPDVHDWLGHGSHVAGIIGARFNNGLGIAGVAPKVTLMAIGVFAPPGYGTFADEVKAILYAVDHGARVINLSLGSNAYSRGEQMAVEYAVRRGVVVAAAAGNNGREIYHWPAAHEAALAVGATTARDLLASFSNRGAFIDLTAPGVSIYSLRPGSNYGLSSGTSMATPHVAGLAALILSRNPSLNPAELRAILETTATDLGATGWDAAYGHGRIDALAALEATPPYTGTVTLPDWLHTIVWPPHCQELIQDGDFEPPLGGHWKLSGAASITGVVSLSGDHALFLVGQPGGEGAASQAFTAPADLHAATLAFGLRVENEDRNLGTDPMNPGRDHLSAWFRQVGGAPLLELLRAGNANFDISAGLPWDRYLHVLSADELALLRAAGEVELWFQADNGADPQPTRFYIDDVRLCATRAPVYLPLQWR